VRITYDRQADAVYIQVTDDLLKPGRTSIRADPPDGVHAFVVLDWKDDRLLGIEVLDVSSRLHHDSSSKPKPSARRRPNGPA
jgi:uncharacterized protein YuzE